MDEHLVEVIIQSGIINEKAITRFAELIILNCVSELEKQIIEECPTLSEWEIGYNCSLKKVIRSMKSKYGLS